MVWSICQGELSFGSFSRSLWLPYDFQCVNKCKKNHKISQMEGICIFLPLQSKVLINDRLN